MTLNLAPAIANVSVKQDDALSVVIGNPATGVNETIEEYADESITFFDALGTVFANYSAGVLDNDSIKVAGTQIETLNNSGEAQNLTFEDTSGDQASVVDLGPISSSEFDLNGAQSSVAVMFFITGTAGSSDVAISAKTANVFPPALDVDNPGTIVVTAGTGDDTLTISGDLSSGLGDGDDIRFIGGAGRETIDASAMTSNTVVEVQAGTGAISVLMGANETLKLDNPADFTGMISGLVAGDTIDLAAIGATTSATLGANDMLAVQGSSGSASLQFSTSENYADDSFLFSSDGNGGTDITAMSDSQNITLPSGNVLLLVNDPAKLTGTISGFVAGDTIDLAGIGTATIATVGANNVLTVTGSGGGTLTVALPAGDTELIAATNGVVVFDTEIGAGTTVVGSSSGVASTQANFTFTSNSSILALPDPWSANGTIYGAVTGDFVELVGVKSAKMLQFATASDPTFKAEDLSTGQISTVQFASTENYSGAQFAVGNLLGNGNLTFEILRSTA